MTESCPSHPDPVDRTHTVEQPAGVSRRTMLQAGALTGAAFTLAPMSFAAASSGTSSKTITGHLDTGAADFVYLPVLVPRGVREIAVSYSYDKPPVPPGTLGNSCDIGIFDERGTALGGAGFRGWSGGFRTEFAVSAESATPGYLPGPVRAGTWTVVLGPYQVAPQGLNYQVQVTLTFGAPGPAFVPHYPPQSIPGRRRAWYRGDCHLHTVYSDGRRLPEEVAAAARAAGLNFMVTTDHNTSSSHTVWGPLAGPDLLILTGEEITTRNGHYLALGLRPGEWVDWRYRARDGDYDAFVRQIHRSGGLVVPAHPYCPYVGCRWKFGYRGAGAVEVWNGPWTLDDELSVEAWDAMLVETVRSRRVGWLPAMGNSDAHSVPQVVGLPQTVVLANGLSRDALLDGIRAGRSWIAESSAIQLDVSATGGGRRAGIGDRLALAAGVPVDVTATVSGVPGGSIRFVTDEGQMQLSTLPEGDAGIVSWRTTPSLATYVRVEVRHPLPADTPSPLPFGAMAAMTNPIFLGR